MNLSQNTVKKTCDMKCQFSFDYPDAFIMGRLSGDEGIELRQFGESNSSPPVKLNNIGYRVLNITFITPSVHKFNDKIVTSEMKITHISDANKFFCIFIPVVNTDITQPMILHEILNEMADVQMFKDFRNLKTKNWTLNDFVPSNSPFYFYESQSQYGIIFGLQNAITLDSKDLVTFKSLCKDIKGFNIQVAVVPMSNFFINNKGANQANSLTNDDFMACEEYDSETLPFNTGQPSAQAKPTQSSSSFSQTNLFTMFPKRGDKLSVGGQVLWILLYFIIGLLIGYMIIKTMLNV